MIRARHSSYIAATLGIFIAVFLLSPAVAWGFFSSTQTAPAQQFAAGVLVLELVADTTLFVQAEAEGVTDWLTVSLTSNSVASYHSLTVIEATGSQDWCSTLTLEAISANGVHVSSSLGTFTTDDAEAVGPWELLVTANNIPQALSAGSSCQAVVEVEAWQQTMSKATSGFRDKTLFTLEIVLGEIGDTNGTDSLGGVVLNELMVRPDSAADSPNNQEWIELYNLGSEAVDLTGWVITEINQSQNTERPHEIVGECVSGSFSETMVTLAGGGTNIGPGEWLVVEFCGSAQYLSVNGDTVRLYQPDAYDMASTTSLSAPVDEFTYTTSSTTANISWSRVPDGTGAWVEQEATPAAANQVDFAAFSFAQSTEEMMIGGETIESETNDQQQPAIVDDANIERSKEDEYENKDSSNNNNETTVEGGVTDKDEGEDEVTEQKESEQVSEAEADQEDELPDQQIEEKKLEETVLEDVREDESEIVNEPA